MVNAITLYGVFSDYRLGEKKIIAEPKSFVSPRAIKHNE